MRRMLVAVPLMFPLALRAQEPGAELLSLSIEDLGRIDVSAASLLPTNMLSAASSVAAPGKLPGVFVMPHSSGNHTLVARGYARLTPFTGVAVTLDGVPLTDLYRSSPQYCLPGLNLGVTGQIQLVQGPVSAMYGSDALHGVLALRTYEADGVGAEEPGPAYRHQVSKQCVLQLVVRNVFNRDNHLPSALGSVGGIPDECINATPRATWRY